MNFNEILLSSIYRSIENSSLNIPNKANVKGLAAPGTNYQQTQLLSTAIELLEPTENGLEDLYTTAPEYWLNADTLNIDLREPVYGMALPQKRQAGIPERWDEIKSDCFKSRDYKTPIFKERYVITAKDLKGRQFGGGIYDNRDPNALVGEKIIRAGRMLTDRLKRTRRWVAIRGLIDGKVAYSGINPDNDEIVDFYRDPRLSIVGTATWSDPAASILTELESTCATIKTVGRVAPDTIVVSPAAKNFILRNNEIQKFLDIRRFENIGALQLNPATNMGLTPFATFVLNGTQTTIYVMDSTYIIDGKSKTETPYLGDKEVLLFNMNATRPYLRTYYGPVDMFNSQNNNKSASIVVGANGLPTTTGLSIRVNSSPIDMKIVEDKYGDAIEITCASAPLLLNVYANTTAKLTLK